MEDYDKKIAPYFPIEYWNVFSTNDSWRRDAMEQMIGAIRMHDEQQHQQNTWKMLGPKRETQASAAVTIDTLRADFDTIVRLAGLTEQE